jgi:anti-sigma factor RsiW
MNCTDADKLMQRSLDDVLSKSERQELDTHLLTCLACTQAFAEYRSLTRLVRDWTSSETKQTHSDDAFLANVLMAIDKAPARRPSAVVQILSICAFVMVVVAAIGYFMGAGEAVPGSVLAPVHPVGIFDAVLKTLMAFPRDETQSIQGWMSESQSGLPLNTAVWFAVGINGLIILSRMVAGRRKAIAGGHHG